MIIICARTMAEIKKELEEHSRSVYKVTINKKHWVDTFVSFQGGIHFHENISTSIADIIIRSLGISCIAKYFYSGFFDEDFLNLMRQKKFIENFFTKYIPKIIKERISRLPCEVVFYAAGGKIVCAEFRGSDADYNGNLYNYVTYSFEIIGRALKVKILLTSADEVIYEHLKIMDASLLTDEPYKVHFEIRKAPKTVKYSDTIGNIIDHVFEESEVQHIDIIYAKNPNEIFRVKTTINEITDIMHDLYSLYFITEILLCGYTIL